MSVVPGTSNLTDYLDKRLLIVLRDDRKLYGILRSFDQFGNLLLHDVVERFYLDLEFADEAVGLLVVRGENVVMVGEIDENEFAQVSRRMGKFRRPIGVFMPRYNEARAELVRQRRRQAALGASELAEHDFY